MTLSLLRRTAGPHGTAHHGDTTTLLEAWELWEGDPDLPHECQGWFRCTDEFFTARKGTELNLRLQTPENDTRVLHVVIEKLNRAEQLWEFFGDR